MFVGVDHGTTAIRFANPEGRCWALSREEASLFSADAILALILEKLGGRIDVQSEPGHGTTFNIFLPAEPPQLAPEEGVEA